MIKLIMENIVAVAKCQKKFDVDNIVRYTEANKDLGEESAKFCFPVATKKGRNIMVNVFHSGKVLCTGANTLERARFATETILNRLGVDQFDYSVKYVVMSGYVTGADILSGMDKLEERYTVKISDVNMKTINVSLGSTLVSFYHTVRPVKVVARGPDEDAIMSVMKDICRICKVKPK